MNQINCKAIAIERLFAQYSDSLSHLDDFSREELSERLGMLPPSERLKIAAAARRGLRELRDVYRLDAELLPDDVACLAGRSISALAEKETLDFFLGWLRELHASNERGRQEWLSSLRTVAARFAESENSFIQSFFALSNQRVFIAFSDGRLTLSAAEREWGRIRAEFTDCIADRLPAMPLPGYAVATEAEVGSDGRLVFSLLIDTCFRKNSDFIDRLLSDDGWQRLEFTCSDISIDITCVDYVGRMLECGTPKADMMENTCRLLLNKAMLLGREGLNPKERAMLPAVTLVGGTQAMREGDVPDWQGEDMILDALNNRYAVDNFLAMIKRSGCQILANCLEKAAGNAYDNDDSGALRQAKLFVMLLNRCIADGSARPLLHSLCSELAAASALNTGMTARVDAEKTALECVERQVVPVMEKLGFSGRFPNFRRRGRDKLEFVSFMLDLKGDCLNRGVISFSASMAAGETEEGRFDGSGAADFSFDDATALDCLAEAFGPSHYAELCGDEDASGAAIEIDLYGERPVVTCDESEILREYIGFAERQFVAGKIPPAYRRERIGFPGKISAFPRSMMRALPAAVVAALTVLVAGIVRAHGGEIERNALLGAALAAGAAVDVLAGAVRCVICSRRLWRY